jgi:hypothetical protein
MRNSTVPARVSQSRAIAVALGQALGALLAIVGPGQTSAYGSIALPHNVSNTVIGAVTGGARVPLTGRGNRSRPADHEMPHRQTLLLRFAAACLVSGPKAGRTIGFFPPVAPGVPAPARRSRVILAQGDDPPLATLTHRSIEGYVAAYFAIFQASICPAATRTGIIAAFSPKQNSV